MRVPGHTRHIVLRLHGVGARERLRLGRFDGPLPGAAPRLHCKAGLRHLQHMGADLGL